MSYFGRDFQVGMKIGFIFILLLTAFCGWAVIEGVVWLFSHVDISIVTKEPKQ